MTFHFFANCHREATFRREGGRIGGEEKELFLPFGSEERRRRKMEVKSRAEEEEEKVFNLINLVLYYYSIVAGKAPDEV